MGERESKVKIMSTRKMGEWRSKSEDEWARVRSGFVCWA
jgi:hypothetical protein